MTKKKTPKRPEQWVPARNRRVRQERKLVLFSCEGEKTEPNYVTALCKDAGLAPPEFAACGGDPWRVVDRAVAEMTNDEYDAVWCIFDCDDHARLADARERARVRNMNVAYSNPCFEIWYLLHYRYSTAYTHRDDAVAECGQRMGSYSESDDVYDQLSPMQNAAAENARRLREEHHAQVNDGRPDNPSTDVDLMVAALRELAGR